MDSYINPVINAAVMTEVDLRRYLGPMMQLDFPDFLLPTFLHESTHHWCFMSPLGNALALLRLRAYRRANALRADRYGDPWDILEDVLRQEATIEYLRPLAEGMACFSELDSLPGQSNAISQPMLTMFFNFDSRNPDADQYRRAGPNLFLFQLLYRARTHSDLAQRRENVLAGQFSSVHGGHLAGYLAVKNIWRYAQQKSDAVWDSELFLCYLRCFFYDDYALIAILLDPTLSEHNAVNAIGTYIFKRFKQFLSMDLEANLRAFESSWAGPPARYLPGGRVVHTTYEGLENDGSLVEIGKQRLETLLFEVAECTSNDPVEQVMAKFDGMRIRKRELLCIGSLPALVRVNEYQRAIATAIKNGKPMSGPTAAGNALPGTPVGEDEGALEFYLIPQEHSRVVAMSRGHDVVYVHFEGPIAEQRQTQLTELLGSRDVDLRIIEEQEANLERVIAENSIRYVRDQLKRTCPPSIDQTYSWLATLHFPPSQWKVAVLKLTEGGFFRLVGDDAAFVRGLAFLGASSSVEPLWSELCKLAEAAGIDLQAVRQTAERLERETGLKTLAIRNDRVLVYV